MAVSKLVNSLKGVSSLYLRKEFTSRANRAITHGPFWSPSYLTASCDGAPPTIIKAHLEQQRRPT